MKNTNISKFIDNNSLNRSSAYLVGLGPGDPELLTIKGLKVLQHSDFIFVPQSDKNGRSIARNIVSYHVSDDKIVLYHIPMTNDVNDLKKRYTSLAEEIESHMKNNSLVSYVTIGDPTIYSTANYLKEKLHDRHIDVILIPAISSCNAISCACNVSLCEKTENFGVYETPKDVQTIISHITTHSTVVFMKVNKKLKYLVEAVTKTSPDQAFLVKRIGLENEEIYDLLKDTPSDEAAYMSTVIIRR